MPTRDKQYLTPQEVAELLMVSPVTVRQWAQKGKLEAQMTAGGHRRFRIETVRQFARDMGLTGVLEEQHTPRVLVVDDDLQLNRLLVEMLTAHAPGVETDTAHDGFEAGLKVSSFQPDIVLLDIMMPKMDGYQVCRHLKSDVDTMHIRVVAMTGYHSPEISSRIMAAGADYFLRKPFPASDLLNACGLGPGADTDEHFRSDHG